MVLLAASSHQRKLTIKDKKMLKKLKESNLESHLTILKLDCIIGKDTITLAVDSVRK